MRIHFASLGLAITLAACAQVATPELNKLLSDASKELGAMPFDSNSSVTLHGHVTTAVWPVGAAGMIVVQAEGTGEKFAFSTARVPDLAKQGFSRFSVKPGAQVVVSGVMTKDKATIGPGFTAARADVIADSTGAHIFERSRLP